MAGLFLGGTLRGTSHAVLSGHMDGQYLGRAVVLVDDLPGLSWALDAVIAVDGDSIPQVEVAPDRWLVESELLPVDGADEVEWPMRLTLRCGATPGHRALVGEWEAPPWSVVRLGQVLPAGRFDVRGPLRDVMPSTASRD